MKALTMHFDAAHGASIKCHWCPYEVDSRRFHNMTRHCQIRHPLQYAAAVDDYGNLKRSYQKSMPIPKDPRKATVPRPPTPVRVPVPSPLQTPITELIRLDSEVAALTDVEGSPFKRAVYQGYTPLNTPDLPGIHGPLNLRQSPPPEALRPSPMEASEAPELDTLSFPLDLSCPRICEAENQAPAATPPTAEETLSQIFDRHRDRALQSLHLTRVVEEDHILEVVEEGGFKYIRSTSTMKLI